LQSWRHYESTLKEIGALPAHRRQLLRAIAELISREKKAPKPAVASGHLPPRATAPSVRQISVMFSDLVSSTALSARIDPEDLCAGISGYQKCVAQVV